MKPKRYTIYENPDNSEVTEEFNSLWAALGSPANPNAEIIENGAIMARELAGRWDLTQAGLKVEHERYASGEWTLEVPTDVGEYAVADRQGHFAGYRSLVNVRGHLVDTRNINKSAGSEWKGWWWTEPHPDLPQAPDATKAD